MLMLRRVSLRMSQLFKQTANASSSFLFLPPGRVQLSDVKQGIGEAVN